VIELVNPDGAGPARGMMRSDFEVLANLPSFFEHLTYALLVISFRFHNLFVRIATVHV
jgi:hypothetical protein